MDPLAFRTDYVSAASATATLISASSTGDAWSVQVLDRKSKPLGIPAVVHCVGSFADVAGAALLDREVVVEGWRANADGSYVAAAKSQRA